MPKLTFSNHNNEFFVSLKKAVDAYFEQNKIKKLAIGGCILNQSS